VLKKLPGKENFFTITLFTNGLPDDPDGNRSRLNCLISLSFCDRPFRVMVSGNSKSVSELSGLSDELSEGEMVDAP
jgi:hypothetical protein